MKLTKKQMAELWDQTVGTGLIVIRVSESEIMYTNFRLEDGKLVTKIGKPIFPVTITMGEQEITVGS